ncbi:uncharacterized protein LOC141714440 [Apium graveolens]|uniref:uncharacterized protein LOC141714440 n=1 Tax=Apium graveolens TaxID=4045 RepID=UPI003D7B386B
MRRSISAGNLEFDLEIERTFRVLRREAKQRKERDKMGERALVIDNQDEPSIRDHETPNLANCIYKTPTINAAQFTINLSLIQMVSNSAFKGDIEREDPHHHLERFVQMCGSFKITGVTTDQIRLHMFPYSIKGRALEWFQQLSDTIVATWETGGDFKKSPVTKAKALLEELAANNYEWAPSGANSVKSAQDTEMMNLLTLKLDALTQEVCGQRANVNSISAPMRGYNDYGVDQYSYAPQFSDEASFIQGRQSWPVQNNSYYNPNQRPNNNLSYNNNHAQNPTYIAPRQNPPPGFQQQQQYQLPPKEKKEPTDWEVTLNKMIQGTTGAFTNIDTKFEKAESRLDHMASSQTMLESQIGQICKAIILRNGRELPKIVAPALKDENLPPKKRKTRQVNMEISNSVDNKPNKERLTHHAPMKPYIPLIPFPYRLKNSKLEKQFEKFLKMFREIHISIPFADALAQIPLYVKFMKEIPPKLNNPGSFSLPCNIGELGIRKALCDLGSSVSLMLHSMYKRLGLGDLKKTRISLQLADRSIKYLLGVLEDILVKVDKFVILCDFVVLEMNEDVDIPIILGRPFLATAGTNIDVKSGKLTLNVGEETVDFDLDQSMRELSVKIECYVVNVVKEINDHAFEVKAEIDENSFLHVNFKV